MSDNRPSDWSLLVGEMVVSEPGDKLTGWKPELKADFIKGPDETVYGWDESGEPNGVRFNITIKNPAGNPAFNALMDIALSGRKVPVRAVLMRNLDAYPDGALKEIGARECRLLPGEGAAGTSEAQDVTFEVLGKGIIRERK